MASALTSTPKAKANEPATNEGNSFVSFVTKPARGWLHPDYLFAQDGINYNVKVSRFHRVDIFGFFSHTDFTSNQFWRVYIDVLNLPLWTHLQTEFC